MTLPDFIAVLVGIGVWLAVAWLLFTIIRGGHDDEC